MVVTETSGIMDDRSDLDTGRTELSTIPLTLSILPILDPSISRNLLSNSL